MTLTSLKGFPSFQLVFSIWDEHWLSRKHMNCRTIFSISDISNSTAGKSFHLKLQKAFAYQGNSSHLFFLLQQKGQINSVAEIQENNFRSGSRPGLCHAASVPLWFSYLKTEHKWKYFLAGVSFWGNYFHLLDWGDGWWGTGKIIACAKRVTCLSGEKVPAVSASIFFSPWPLKHPLCHCSPSLSVFHHCGSSS